MCCKRKRFGLNRTEIDKINSLRERSRVKYDPSNKIHQEELKKLWQLSFGGEPKLVSEEWISIGFQTEDPSTDFRGGGIFSLQQLNYFAENYSENYEKVKRSEYSFAICSINLTHFFMYYFQLLSRKAQGTSDYRRAPPVVMKTFARINAEEPHAIFEIHSLGAIKMHENWIDLCRTSTVTIMDFMKALISATYFIENILITKPSNLDEFRNIALQQL